MRPLNISGSQAKDYYYAGDPVFDTAENSEWSGVLADEYGLAGSVKEEHFLNIIAGNNLSGEQIIQDGTSKEGKSEHRAAVDIPLAAPKSVSIMALHVEDKNILSAHKQAVADTIKFIEQNYVYARKTENGHTRAFNTGKGIFATFDHSTSRANDPHLHTHTLVMNMTQTADGYRAVFNDKIFQDQTLINSAYQGFLAKHIRDAGYGIAYKERGLWEIAGVKDEWIKTFSKRQSEIDKAESALVDNGEFSNAEDAKVRDIAQRSSRANKSVKISKDELLYQWQSQVDRALIGQAVAKNMGGKSQLKLSEADYIKTAYSAINETESTFKRKDVVHMAMQLSRGHYTVYDMQTAFNQSINDGEVVRLVTLTNSKGLDTEIYTSREMKEIEQNILNTFNRCIEDMDNSVGKISLHKFIKDNFDYLNKGQQKAVEEMLMSKSRFSIIQGDAGTGKTSALEAVKSFVDHEKLKLDVVGLGYTGKAAKELKSASGIESHTIHSFLGNREIGGADNKPQLWVVDESSMVGSRQMQALMHEAVKVDARAVFIGDGKQLQAIAAGKMFIELQQHGRGELVVLDQVLRQKTPEMKSLVGYISNFHGGTDPSGIDKAFDVLGDNRNLKVHTEGSKRIDEAVRCYLGHGSPTDCLIVTPLNNDRVEINKQIRSAINKNNPKPEITTTIKNPVSMVGTSRYFARNYKQGHCVFVAESNIDGIKAGQEATITGIDERGNTISLDTGNGKPIKVDLQSNLIDLSVYAKEQRKFSAGDRLVFLKNDKAVGVQNSLTGTVEKIDPNGVFTVKVDDSKKRVTFHKDHFQYYDHGYAVTVHKSQGQTSKSVVFVTNSKSPLNKFESFYTAMTRAKEKAVLICDNVNELIRQFKVGQGKTSVIEFAQKERALIKPKELVF